MITQRKASYLPDVIIARSIFYIKTGVGTDNKPFIKFNAGIPESGISPKIKLHNIGRGVAKNFEYEFINNIWGCFTAMEQFYADKYFTFKNGNFALIDKNGFIRSRVDDFGNPKIYYRGTISEEEKYDEDGAQEEISMLKEDIAKLLNE